MHRVPILLTLLRAALAPVFVVMALTAPSKVGFGLGLVAALLSDIFDGVIARRLGVATPGLRRLDSAADSLFYLAATFAVWRLHGEALSARATELIALAALELSRYLVDWMKFGREASYHMWSSKVWGLALFGGFLSILAFGIDGILVDAAILVGIVADLEGLLISAILKRWETDVPTFVHAWRRRASAGR